MRTIVSLGMVLISASLCPAADPEQKIATVPDLIQQLSSNDFHSRQRAAKQLGNLGLAARDAVPALSKALRDSSPKVGSSAAKALAAIGVPAVPALIEALIDPTTKNHAQIARACHGSRWAGPIGSRHRFRSHPRRIAKNPRAIHREMAAMAGLATKRIAGSDCEGRGHHCGREAGHHTPSGNCAAHPG